MDGAFDPDIITFRIITQLRIRDSDDNHTINAEVRAMSVKDAVAERFINLCKEQSIRLNELANRSGVTPSTVYSLVDVRRRDVSIITIKKICDGLDITLGEFFQSSEFDKLEQEIK